MRALALVAVILSAGCTKSDPPKETAPAVHLDGGKTMARVAKSAAAASAMVPASDAAR